MDGFDILTGPIIGLILGILGILGFEWYTKNKSFVKDQKYYDDKKKEKEDELKEKPASDIVNSLDNSSDIQSIKDDSDDEFDRVRDRKKREAVDRFRSGSADKGDS